MTAGPAQTDRLLELTSLLAINELMLVEFSGNEALSEVFQFNLKVISSNTNIIADRLLGTPVTIRLNAEKSAQPRYFHGYIFNFYAGDINNGLRTYHIEVFPWLYFLNYASDCRIFQNKTIVEIIKLIFAEYNFSYYDVTKLTKIYQARDYCVQYHETTLSFINRILTEEGVFYFFRHEKDKHTLVLADKNSALPPCTHNNVSYNTQANNELSLTQWQHSYNFYAGNFTQTDYNFENPTINLLSKQSANTKLAASKNCEHFHYPGNYKTPVTGKATAQQQFETHEMQYDLINGEGNYSGFASGAKFTLNDYQDATDNGDYILTSVTHYAAENLYLPALSSGYIYHNFFRCLRITTPYRPMHLINKPLIAGAQTAIVVGPSAEELYTDKYGQVKVQFHWDRQSKKDDNSSCWIRVAQNWAGQHWGTLFMPRIGQEVIVQFLNGDPDQPLIIGSVYNADNLPPYSLPISQTQSGIKTASANELRFEDKPGQEEIYIHAQKDLIHEIENNESTLIINGNHSINVQAGASMIEAAQAITLKVGASQLLINTQGVYINGQLIK